MYTNKYNRYGYCYTVQNYKSTRLNTTTLSSDSSIWISGTKTSDVNPSWLSSDWNGNFVPYYSTFRIEDKFNKRIHTNSWYRRKY